MAAESAARRFGGRFPQRDRARPRARAAAQRPCAARVGQHMDRGHKGRQPMRGGRWRLPQPMPPGRPRNWPSWMREESGRPGPLGIIRRAPPTWHPRSRDLHAVAEVSAPGLSPFLTRMHPAGRRQARAGNLCLCRLEGLELLGLGPTLIAEKAKDRARRYAVQFPRQDEDLRMQRTDGVLVDLGRPLGTPFKMSAAPSSNAFFH